MPEGEKPYRLYRGGRVKGRVPLQRLSPQTANGKVSPPEGPAVQRKRRQPHWGRRLALALLVLIVLVVAWIVASYLAFSHGIDEANARVPKSVASELAKQDGLLISKPTQILVIGTDGGSTPGREGANRSDTLMLLRTDPRKHRLAFLSIPRDLRVDIPGYGPNKINTAFRLGGPTLALRTVKALTGLEPNHIAIVDFDSFKELVDAVGGIDVDVPAPILSNAFDCPFSSAECNGWKGWRFEKGRQRMDGRRALVYSRIRENRLDPAETDFDRAQRQQQVIQGVADKLTSIGVALKLPFIGKGVVRPLTTDLTAGQLLQLGWTYFRADTKKALHCRLGGEPSNVGGEAVILGSEDNAATVSMFTGRSAPLPPQKGLPYAPGCRVGERG